MNARWPRLMKRKTAAEYCDLSESAFEREVLAGKFPAPMTVGHRDHWDRFALDRAINHITGAPVEADYRQELKERYGSQAA